VRRPLDEFTSTPACCASADLGGAQPHALTVATQCGTLIAADWLITGHSALGSGQRITASAPGAAAGDQCSKSPAAGRVNLALALLANAFVRQPSCFQILLSPAGR